jgi:hypothetical protein
MARRMRLMTLWVLQSLTSPSAPHVAGSIALESSRQRGHLTIITEGSSYDTIVAAWDYWGYQLGCVDDHAYPNVLTSAMGGWVAAGKTNWIHVAAWDDGGTLQFQLGFQASGGWAYPYCHRSERECDGPAVSPAHFAPWRYV